MKEVNLSEYFRREGSTYQNIYVLKKLDKEFVIYSIIYVHLMQ